jgi:glucose/mannose-6-phosphate isomerase
MKLIDQHDIRGSIRKFPDQIVAGYTTKFDFKPYKLPKDANYIVCGMGGSSFITDILHDVIESDLQMTTSRTYHLPKETNKKSLVVVVSFSGTTEEALSCYQEARKRRLPLIAMASRGTLMDWAVRDKVPFARISTEGITQPRYSTGYQYGYHAKILEMHKMIPSQRKTIFNAYKEAKHFNFENQGKKFAHAMVGTLPFIYTDADYGSVARAMTIKIDENAKLLSHWNTVPEMNHNEMNGFVLSKKQGKFSVFSLVSKSFHPRVLKRFKVVDMLAKKYGAASYTFWLPGKTKLARMIAGIGIADWVSFYMSQENKIDPSPVAIVEEFKKLIG